MLTLLEVHLRAWMRRYLGESGNADLIVVLLVVFLVWLLIANRRIVVQ